MTGLTLAIIAKNEVDQLERIVKDYGKYFEEIVVAYDSEPVPEIEGIRFVKYDWCDDFSHKRNFLADNVETDYYMRIDTDDEIINPENIKSLFIKSKSLGADCVNVPYFYGFDKDGNCIAEHWRETIIRKKEGVYWKKPVHENIFVDDPSSFNNVKDSSVKILHRKTDESAKKSAERNYKILVEEFKRDGEKTDPRTIAYIGRMLMGAGQFESAIKFLEVLVSKSGWDDDKYFAYSELAFCHLMVGNYKSSISSSLEAIVINSEYPDAYICMAHTYLEQKEYEKALSWIKQANIKKKPDTMYVIDPSRYTIMVAKIFAMTYFYLGDYEKSLMFFNKVKEVAPSDQWVNDNYRLFEEGYDQHVFMKNFSWMYKYVSDYDSNKLADLVKAVPRKFICDERIQHLRHRHLPRNKWSDKSIVIYCFETPHEWAAPSVITGIGGSEEAVIYMSKELSKLGYEVTVFCNCGDMKGVYEGVEYKEFFEFNRNDEFCTLITWRLNGFFKDIKAKRKLVWLHDVFSDDQRALWFSDKSDADKFIVLSQSHRELIPEAFPEDRVFVSSNGINIPDFMTNGVMRNPHRMIYTSSYDRGIQHLLQMWPDIKNEVPEAELHIFYGWDLYDAFIKTGNRSQEFKEKMVELMKQDGVYEHGRIGHKQLVKELQKSKFFVYPSHFYEISCISAMKAQACGCVPVVTDFAALKETVKDGIFVKGSAEDPKVREEYKKALIKALKEQPSMSVDKNQFSWEKVAAQWDKELLK